MDITFDPAKREATLRERGLDFLDAALVFDGDNYSEPDEREDYGEERVLTVGFLRGRMVVLIWTSREGARRIISMRKANDREQSYYGPLTRAPR